MDFIIRLNGLEWLKQILISGDTSSRSLRKVLLIVYDLAVKESDRAMDCEEYKGNLVKDGFATMDDAMD